MIGSDNTDANGCSKCTDFNDNMVRAGFLERQCGPCESNKHNLVRALLRIALDSTLYLFISNYLKLPYIATISIPK